MTAISPYAALVEEWMAQVTRSHPGARSSVYSSCARQLAAVEARLADLPVYLTALTDDDLVARVTTLWDAQIRAQKLDRDLEAALIATEREQEKRTR